ncbi:MAG: hypothetical protein E6Q78_02420 [Rhodoferax sp.]|nr:MAG: hypothetical protein E6Q78_02420 [Rhodoferax sp.]
MFLISRTRHTKFFQTTVLVSALGYSAFSVALPSQTPLLSKDGGGVSPNLLVTVDESGSMMYQHLPENVNKIVTSSSGAKTNVWMPGDKMLRLHPSDNRYFSGTNQGFVPAEATGNIFQLQMRSPDVNRLYYNPDVRYLPWIKSDGSRMANAEPTKAYFDPLNIGTSSTAYANLTAAATSYNITWCTSVSAPSPVPADLSTLNNGVNCSSSSKSYRPGLFYRLKKSGSFYLDPNSTSNYVKYDINDAATLTVTKHVNRTDCAGSVCTQAEERINFANWFVFHRSRLLVAQAGLPEAFVSIDGTKIRVGWGHIHKGAATVDGTSGTSIVVSGVRDFTSTRKNDFFTFLRGISVNSGTPLRQAMWGAGRYFETNTAAWADDPTSPSSGTPKACRRAYHLLMTDGYWNDTGAPSDASFTTVGNADNVNGSKITGTGREYTYIKGPPYSDSNSNTLADYAMYYWKRDLRSIDNSIVPSPPDPTFWQGMVNYTVGLGLTGELDPVADLAALSSSPPTKSWGTNKIDDLWHAALNTQGKFFSANNSVELATSLSAALSKTLQNELREAGVATSSTVLEDGNRKYVPYYKSGIWTGDVRAYELTASGTVKPGSGPDGELWNAESKLPPWDQRNMVSWNGTQGVSFTWTGIGSSGQAALGAGATSKLVDWVRGDATYEQTATSASDRLFRTRSKRLGDFINSNPVLAKGGESLGYDALALGGSSAYTNFLADKARRVAVLYVGANDGMLHAFKDTNGVTATEDGKEVFTFIPRSIYPKLASLASTSYAGASHQFFVDGFLAQSDVYVRAPSATTATWRNYLVGTLGAGGKGVYALDITDGIDTSTGKTPLGVNSVRWEIDGDTYNDLGYVKGPVTVGVLPNGKWVAVFGNGRYSTNGRATLFVVDIETGAVNTLQVDSAEAIGAGNGLGGVGVIRDSKGQITTLYAGDLKGQLWKLNYAAAAASYFEVDKNGGAVGVPLLAATGPTGAVQSFTQAPMIYPHTKGGYLVVAGTGRLDDATDAASTAVETLYGVWDKASDSIVRPLGRSNLDARTLASTSGSDVSAGVFFQLNGSSADWVANRGWRIDLTGIPITALRVIYPLQKVTSKVALVSAVAPASPSAVACDSVSGEGLNLLFNVEEGLPPGYSTFDTNGDGYINSSDRIVAGFKTAADGLDSLLKGKSTCETSGTCYREISDQTTTGQMKFRVEDDPASSVGKRATKDRVVRQIINPPLR